MNSEKIYCDRCYECISPINNCRCDWGREQNRKQELLYPLARKYSRAEIESINKASFFVGLFGASILAIVYWDTLVNIWLGIGSSLLLPFGLSFIFPSIVVGAGLIILGYMAVIPSIAIAVLAVFISIITLIVYILVFHQLPPGLNFSNHTPQNIPHARPK
jgi:hypothetical protein